VRRANDPKDAQGLVGADPRRHAGCNPFSEARRQIETPRPVHVRGRPLRQVAMRHSHTDDVAVLAPCVGHVSHM
jgi:membrane-anchored protein YejM (alkaline phosphatase superfamily)